VKGIKFPPPRKSLETSMVTERSAPLLARVMTSALAASPPRMVSAVPVRKA
jgi:hypothetical protein